MRSIQRAHSIQGNTVFLQWLLPTGKGSFNLAVCISGLQCRRQSVNITIPIPLEHATVPDSSPGWEGSPGQWGAWFGWEEERVRGKEGGGGRGDLEEVLGTGTTVRRGRGGNEVCR